MPAGGLEQGCAPSCLCFTRERQQRQGDWWVPARAWQGGDEGVSGSGCGPFHNMSTVSAGRLKVEGTPGLHHGWRLSH